MLIISKKLAFSKKLNKSLLYYYKYFFFIKYKIIKHKKALLVFLRSTAIPKISSEISENISKISHLFSFFPKHYLNFKISFFISSEKYLSKTRSKFENQN